MSAIENKLIMQGIFSELSKGNDQPFIDAMAEDMQWIWMDSGQWSKIYDGRKVFLDELWSAVKTTLVSPYKVIAHRFIADDDYVVVEAIGQNITPDGKKYNNKYCWCVVFQIVNYMN
jgi:ketosteroid isomerase-like protein